MTIDAPRIAVGAAPRAGAIVSRIELWSDGAELPRGLLGSLRLYASEDNFRYLPIEDATAEVLRSGGRVVIAMEFAPRIVRFFKVGTVEGPRSEVFSGSLSRLLHLLGEAGEPGLERPVERRARS